MDVRRRSGSSIQVKAGSKRICQERYICEGSKAEFDCSECGTRQCGQCEEKLHSTGKFTTHSRTKIEHDLSENGGQLCGMWCYPYNSAEYSCLECKNLFCSECNRAFHRGKLSKHHRALLPRQEKIVETECNLSDEAKTILKSQEGPLSSLSSGSPDLDSFLDALPPPLSILPPSHPSLDGICSQIKEKQIFEDVDDTFHSLEKTNLPEEPSESPVSVSHQYQSQESQKSSIESGEFCSLEPRFSATDTEFVVGPSEGFGSIAPIGQSPNPDFVETRHAALNPLEREDLQLKHKMDLPGKGLSDIMITDPADDFTMSRGMLASTDSDITKPLIIPDDYSQIERGSGPHRSGVSPSSEESLLMLQNASLNQSPPTSLDSDPGRTKPKKEAVVRGMRRTPPSSTTNSGPEMLETATLQTVSKYKRGFLLVNENEELQVSNSEELFAKLGCPDNCQVKVVSIFGNTGDGKSYTLNHSFFRGEEVFHTSDSQQSCTIGVWAAYQREQGVVTIDTEGLLGTSSNENRRMRLLLKILAVSDVVIYRTRAERLGRDMFQFLGDASKAFVKHFAKELEVAVEKIGLKGGGMSSLGPAVIVFHETVHTKPLGGDVGSKPADTLLQKQFEDLGSSINAFRSLQYVGVQTATPPTSFKKIRSAISKHIEDTAVRSPRSPSVVYQALKVLNDKFCGKITASLPATFPDEYFTCPEQCLSCSARCKHTMNHSDMQGHVTESLCKYQHQFDNRVFLCMACSDKDGVKREVVPKTCSSNDSSWLGLMKYAWSGYVLECPKCGIIYRSRERWYGNDEPNVTAVRSEIRHIWPGDNIALQGTHNAARKLVDGLSTVVDTISTVGAKPSKVMSQWMSDQIAPAYWKPNASIVLCNNCRKNFEDTNEPIHHCRACGEGVCDDCSQRKLAVPERGWGETPVRVCNVCYEKNTEADTDDGGGRGGSPEEQPVTARIVGEAMQTTISTLGTAVSYPLGYMVDVARPAYWIPDHEITNCACCEEVFGPKLRIHHCRLCGRGVCDPCSGKRRPVPSRGWDTPVRICDTCDGRPDPL